MTLKKTKKAGLNFVDEVIEYIFEIYEKYKLPINKNKCGIFRILNKHQQTNNNIKINNIPVVNEYKYLGILDEPSLTYK